VIDTVITFDPETYEESIQIIKSSVYKVVEDMPRFPGCEDISGKKERKECSDKRMLEHIYKNVVYPAKAKSDGIEGMVVASFIVPAFAGKVHDIKILRNVSPEIDAEVIRILNEMPPWIPGQVEGENVNVRFNLPVRFKLQ